MEARLIEAMDRGEWLENHEAVPGAKMYKDVHDNGNGPYVFVFGDGQKTRANGSFDYCGWDIMKKPATRPATRMEALYDITGPEHLVAKYGDGNWLPAGYSDLSRDITRYDLGTIHADGTVTDIRKLTRPAE